MKFIQEAQAAMPGTSATGTSPEADLVATAVPFILIFVVFYFLILRPQQRKYKLQQAMVAAIRRGDKVVTNGGILGKVVKVEDEGILQIEIADEVIIKVLSSAVSTVVGVDKPVNDNSDKLAKSKKKL